MRNVPFSLLINPKVALSLDMAKVVAQTISNSSRHGVIIAEPYRTKQKLVVSVDAKALYKTRQPFWNPTSASPMSETKEYVFVMYLSRWEARDYAEAHLAAMCISNIVAASVTLIPKKIRADQVGWAWPQLAAHESREPIWRDPAGGGNPAVKKLAVDSRLAEAFFTKEKVVWGSPT